MRTYVAMNMGTDDALFVGLFGTLEEAQRRADWIVEEWVVGAEPKLLRQWQRDGHPLRNGWVEMKVKP